MTFETWHMIVALFALIGPGLVYIGITVGKLTERTTAQGLRLDRLDNMLREEIHRLGDRLEKSLSEAWRHCPMASDHKE